MIINLFLDKKTEQLLEKIINYCGKNKNQVISEAIKLYHEKTKYLYENYPKESDSDDETEEIEMPQINRLLDEL